MSAYATRKRAFAWPELAALGAHTGYRTARELTASALSGTVEEETRVYAYPAPEVILALSADDAARLSVASLADRLTVPPHYRADAYLAIVQRYLVTRGLDPSLWRFDANPSWLTPAPNTGARAQAVYPWPYVEMFGRHSQQTGRGDLLGYLEPRWAFALRFSIGSRPELALALARFLRRRPKPTAGSTLSDLFEVGGEDALLAYLGSLRGCPPIEGSTR